jgi:hypothetical protein
MARVKSEPGPPMTLAQQMHEATLEELVGFAARDPGSQFSEAAKAELSRPEIFAQQEAARAQQEAAHYTKQSARWMFWSVVVVAITSLASLGWQIWSRH